jgi:hypothetical protein
MKQRQREAILAQLATRLRQHHSWCGETHLQKAAFVLEGLLDVPLGFGHILYKYGPFAYDLRDELSTMQADGFLEREQISGYGPRLKPTAAAKRQLLEKWPKTLRRYEPSIEFVAEHFAARGVGELERLATALWVQNEHPDADRQQQARRLHELKPHVSLEQAREALATIDEWRTQAATMRTPSQRRRARAS